MPNHITNQLDFDCSEERFKEILEFLKVEDGPLGSVDFNKLIPMPECLMIEAGSRGHRGLELYRQYLADTEFINDPSEKEKIKAGYVQKCEDDPEVFDLGRQYYENLRDYGSTTWYDWSIANWGTKWNAYDYMETDPTSRQICFSTAWSPVPQILSKISERYPDVRISYAWADEDIGYNTGRAEFLNGEVTVFDVPEGGSREAFELATELWGYDMSEFEEYIPKEETPVSVGKEKRQLEEAR